MRNVTWFVTDVSLGSQLASWPSVHSLPGYLTCARDARWSPEEPQDHLRTTCNVSMPISRLETHRFEVNISVSVGQLDA